MNRFPSINNTYASRDASGRGCAPYSNSNGNLHPGGQPSSNIPPQLYGPRGAHPNSLYQQNGNYSNASMSPSSYPTATLEQQAQQQQHQSQAVQNFYHRGSYGGFQYQHQAPTPYQGQVRFPIRNITPGQQQYCMHTTEQQYAMIQHLSQLQNHGQQHSPLEQQNMFQYYHPYQRPGQTETQQSKRTTRFLEQLLENKPSSRASYPYQNVGPRGMVGASPGLPSSYSIGYGSLARQTPSRPRHRSAFVAAGSQIVSPAPASQQPPPSNNPMTNRNLPINLTLYGDDANIAAARKEGGMLRELLKGKADERFKQNTVLFEEILDDKIVDANPTVVTTQRLSNLEAQVGLLSGALDKQEEDLNKTKEACEKRLEEFKASNQAHVTAYDKLCKPISRETYRELIDKYYYEFKEKGTNVENSCDCTEAQETSNGKAMEVGKVKIDEVPSSITPPPSSGDGDDSSSDLTIIGEFKPKQNSTTNVMNEGSSEGYLEGGYDNQNSGVNGASLQLINSVPSQQPPHFGYNYQSPPNGTPSSAHWAAGEHQSFAGGHQFYDRGNYNYEPVTPPPQYPGVPSSSQVMGHENFGGKPSFPMQRLVPDGGTLKAYPSSWSAFPNQSMNHLQKAIMQQQQHPPTERQHLKELRERPSEELRNFLIKLVKQKCGEDWRALRNLPEGGDEGQPMKRPNLFCGGGIMEVKQGPQATPLAAPVSFPFQLPPCDWLRDDIPVDESPKQEKENVSTEEPQIVNTEGDDDDDDEGRLVIAEPEDAEEDESDQRKVETPELEAAVGNGSGSSSKLAELLDKPLAIDNRNNLKQVEIALDSEHKLQISDNGNEDGAEEDQDNMLAYEEENE